MIISQNQTFHPCRHKYSLETTTDSHNVPLTMWSFLVFFVSTLSLSTSLCITSVGNAKLGSHFGWTPASSTLSRFCTSQPSQEETTATNSQPKKPEGIELMEIRVGKIVGIDTHPEADTLYVEQVDLGEEDGPRTIVSGLVEYCTAEELLNRQVTVLCNLKPRALKGVTSAGMLLCASNKEEGKVLPLMPPTGAELGELVSFEGYTMQPVAPGNKASKVFSKISGDFFVNDDGVATFKGTPFMTTVGPIESPLKGPIS